MAYDQLLLLTDNNCLKTFACKANATISGGQLLKFSENGTIGSRLSTYTWDDITVDVCDSAENCVGVALNTTTSGNAVTVLTDGFVILPVGSSVVSGGQLVSSAGYDNCIIGCFANASGTKIPIGRAFTNGAALGYAVVNLHV